MNNWPKHISAPVPSRWRRSYPRVVRLVQVAASGARDHRERAHHLCEHDGLHQHSAMVWQGLCGLSPKSWCLSWVVFCPKPTSPYHVWSGMQIWMFLFIWGSQGSIGSLASLFKHLQFDGPGLLRNWQLCTLASFKKHSHLRRRFFMLLIDKLLSVDSKLLFGHVLKMEGANPARKPVPKTIR